MPFSGKEKTVNGNQKRTEKKKQTRNEKTIPAAVRRPPSKSGVRKSKGGVFPRTKYSISQNFLTSSITIKKLLQKTSIRKTDSVVEIGAGKGHMTKELAVVCRQVTAYEADWALAEALVPKMEQYKNVRIIKKDFLRMPLPPKGDYKVFSNIPFSITSDIIRKLTEKESSPTDIWIVMEKGAAVRFLGKKYETPASLSLKPFFDAKIVHYFEKKDFHPEPSVDTVFLHLQKKKEPDIPFSQKKKFLQFIDVSQKYGLLKLLTRKQISVALKNAGLPPLNDSEELTYRHWLFFFRASQGE